MTSAPRVRRALREPQRTGGQTELCGDDVPDVVADDDDGADDDDDAVLRVDDNAEDALAPVPPAEIAPKLFGQLLAAALREW